jgi:4'-phosphopantetheinyl transferase EntD
MADCFSWFANAEIAVHEMAIAEASEAELLPEELAHVARAVPKRVQEFASGRICARRAMAKLGLPPAPIPAAADRSPIWPAGLIGSITHAGGYAAAAVARAGGSYAALALDLEPAEPLPEDILDIISRPEERAWLASQSEGDRALLARAIFSAKECAYKLQYPLSRQMLEFADFSLTLDLPGERFLAQFTRPCAPFPRGGQISGHIRISGGFIACAAALPHAARQ